MLIPSIDIMGGRAVQLVGGERFELDGGDPMELAERFSVLGEIAVVDLDAAMGKGSNIDLVCTIASRYPCRVGGGVRDEATMVRLLDAGARFVMVGTMATPKFLSSFPRERLVAALDNKAGVVMTEGWTRSSGLSVLERVTELSPYVGGFLITAIDIEGSLSGIDTQATKSLVASIRATGFSGSLTIAGGVRSASEVATLDVLGADAQVGMALYKGILDPADAIAACLRSDRPDGLWPTVVCDEAGVALGLVYSDTESLRIAIAERAGVYHSRMRGLWRKGESSGDRQTLVRVDVDCDRDSLRSDSPARRKWILPPGNKDLFRAARRRGLGWRRVWFFLAYKDDRQTAYGEPGRKRSRRLVYRPPVYRTGSSCRQDSRGGAGTVRRRRSRALRRGGCRSFVLRLCEAGA
ncbi:hypothetical protein MASR2M48_12850 [Spirochaetota bacterium]